MAGAAGGGDEASYNDLLKKVKYIKFSPSQPVIIDIHFVKN
jgi:hypothetical protein